MASYSLTDIGRQYLLAPASFLKSHSHSWLVFVPPQSAVEFATVTTIARPSNAIDPQSTQPMAIEVIKGIKPNVFPFGVTVGRTENNDIVLRHEEVSRFHAYFQEQEGKLCLVDADSKNGTFLEGKRLTPLKPAPLGNEGTLRFGQLEVRYYDSQRFILYLERSSSVKSG